MYRPVPQTYILGIGPGLHVQTSTADIHSGHWSRTTCTDQYRRHTFWALVRDYMYRPVLQTYILGIGPGLHVQTSTADIHSGHWSGTTCTDQYCRHEFWALVQDYMYRPVLQTYILGISPGLHVQTSTADIRSRHWSQTTCIQTSSADMSSGHWSRTTCTDQYCRHTFWALVQDYMYRPVLQTYVLGIGLGLHVYRLVLQT